MKSENNENPDLSPDSDPVAPLGDEEINLVRKKLNWSHQPFEIPEEILKEWADKAMCYRWLHSKSYQKYSRKNERGTRKFEKN